MIPLVQSDNRHAYRPDVDGLRGIAVLAVVCYHAFPEWLSGGFIGVDVFFVISGYLITQILLTSVQRGQLSLTGFYIRRALRLFPAMLVVMLFVGVLGWFSLYADEYRQLGKHIAGGAGFVANLLLWDEAGYFDSSAHTKPLLHLWSLSVEEQFYLIWPAALWLVIRARISVAWFIGVSFVASLAANFWHLQSDAAAAFFAPHTRFWELAAGAMLAYWSVFASQGKTAAQSHQVGAYPRWSAGVRNAASFVGIVLIALSAIWFRGDMPYPGWRACVPTAGAALVIAAGSGAWLNRVVLSLSWLVVVGLVSFPLYLWHWPLLSFSHITHVGMPELPVRAVVVVLSFLLAWLTYRYIETPVRHGPAARWKTPALASAMLLAGGIGGLIYALNGLPERFPNASRDAQRLADWDYPGENMTQEKLAGVQVYRVGGNGMQTLFFGDSNMEQYGPRITTLLKHLDQGARGAIFLTQGGAAPIDGISRSDGYQTSTTDFVKIASRPEVDRVVIGAAWSLYLYENKAELGLSGPIVPRYFADGESLEKPEGRELAANRMADMVQTLISQGKRVYLVGGIPAGKEFLVQTRAAPRQLFLKDSAAGQAIPTVPVETVSRRLDTGTDILTSVANRTGATLILPMHHLCSAAECPTDRHKDAGHLRASFVRSNVTYLDVAVSP